MFKAEYANFEDLLNKMAKPAFGKEGVVGYSDFREIVRSTKGGTKFSEV